MKKIFVMFALMTGAVSAFAQNAADSISAETGRVTMTRELYPGQEDGDLYHGLTRKLTFDRMVPPYGLEVTYDKTTHIIFPSAVRYVDLGSPNLVAGKADGAENVIRVKAVVTRYNTNTDTYLVPDNVGMPFNSPYNDYMYVIDEYNNLGWFASDRFQPEGKVCIYVFIPNTSKQTYNYEAMEQQQIIRLAQIHSLKETWKDKQAVTEALQRLEAAISHKPKERRAMDFEFVIDDHTTYYLMSDFKSAKAKSLFQRYQQMEKDYYQQEEKLNSLRQQYAGANQQGKEKMAPAILDLEKRVLQMSEELDTLEVNVRNAEKTK